MQKLALLLVCLLPLSCGKAPSAKLPVEPQMVLGSASCFHGWVSEKGNTYPSGECKRVGLRNTPASWTSIEVDYPSQQLFVHGKWYEDGKSEWMRFKAVSCVDDKDGWTTVTAVGAGGEKYSIRQREIKEIPAPGKTKKAFVGEAKMTVEIHGKLRTVDLACTRFVF